MHVESGPKNDPNNSFWKEAILNVRPSNANISGAVSFEWEHIHGYFGRHSGYILQVNNNDGSDLFIQDSSFYVHNALDNPGGPDLFSFESVNYRNYYLSYDWNQRIQILPLDVIAKSSAYKNSTWRVSPPIFNFTEHLVNFLP